jgi:hypothetical protein
MIKSHLRAEVWEHEGRKLVVVAFGGTVFTSGKDWKANLRWFTPWHNDEYTQIVKLFAPDFVGAFASRRANEADEVTIYSTGHSLGGGLAQQFAYALPTMPRKQKVSKVYAFDPLPVTGFYSVDRATREKNRVGLQIARIYERGEILAIVRSFTSLIIKPSSVNPEIRGVRFNLFYTKNAIAGHSIVELASKMQAAAGVPALAPSVMPPLHRLLELLGRPERHLFARLDLDGFPGSRMTARPRGALPDLESAKPAHPDPRAALQMRRHCCHKVHQKPVDLLFR